MTVIEQSRVALQAGVAAKHATKPWLTYEFQRNGLTYRLSQPILDDNLAATHQWLRQLVISQQLPKSGWWYVEAGPR